MTAVFIANTASSITISVWAQGVIHVSHCPGGYEGWNKTIFCVFMCLFLFHCFRREGEGLRVFWDKLREPSLVSRWNPFTMDYPYTTLTYHPVRNVNEKLSKLCEVRRLKTLPNWLLLTSTNNMYTSIHESADIAWVEKLYSCHICVLFLVFLWMLISVDSLYCEVYLKEIL